MIDALTSFQPRPGGDATAPLIRSSRDSAFLYSYSGPAQALSVTQEQIIRINDAVRRWNSAFGRDLDARLRDAGISTSQLVPLNIDTDGVITSEMDYPEKEVVENMFISDPLLTEQFRMLAADMNRVAELRVSFSYRQEWASSGPLERRQLWKRYSALSNLLNLLAGQAILADRRLHWSGYQLALSGSH